MLDRLIFTPLQFIMRNKNLILAITACLGIAALVWIVRDGARMLESPTPERTAQIEYNNKLRETIADLLPQKNNSSSMPPITPSILPTFNSTYRPGAARPTRITTGDLDTIEYRKSNPRWRLYAKSAEEARWLDQYGYPTPAEEAKLEASSTEALKAMAEGGDLNAMAHYGIRWANAATVSKNPRDAIVAGAFLYDLIKDGGPYQATVVRNGINQIAEAYQSLPESEQTPERFKALAPLIYPQQVGWLVGELYDDVQTNNRNVDYTSRLDIAERYPQLESLYKISERTLIGLIQSSIQRRQYRGLPPPVITLRPNDFTVSTNTVYERY